MTLLTDIDLRRDDAANLYVKEEVVQVIFATEPGELVSREGPNRYRVGDAIVTGSTGDRWCVSRERFEARYDPVPGMAGAYRNKPVPVPVLAREME